MKDFFSFTFYKGKFYQLILYMETETTSLTIQDIQVFQLSDIRIKSKQLKKQIKFGIIGLRCLLKISILLKYLTNAVIVLLFLNRYL